MANASPNASEEPDLQVRWQLQLLEHQQVERAAARVEHQDADQHQRGAGQGVQEELERGVDAPRHDPAQEVVGAVRVAPAADQEVHRDEGQLPEDVKQHQVERHEDADHAAFEQQHQEQVRPQPLLDPLPGENQHQHGQEGGEQHQEEAQPIHPDEVLDLELLHPGQALDELHARLAGLPPGPQQAGDREGGQAHQQRPPLLQPRARQDQQHQRSREGEEGDDRKQWDVQWIHKGSLSSKMPSRSIFAIR